MRGETRSNVTQESSIIYTLSELEPRTIEALVEVLNRLAQIIESQCQESLRQCYEEDAQHAARDQLSLDFSDDSDIAVRDTDNPPF